MHTLNPIIKRPSAFLPVVMSLAALALVLGFIALFGGARQSDEGPVAHIWQILMIAQVPFMAFFAVKYIPQRAKQALLVLAIQVAAALTACAPVFFLKL